MFNKALKPWFWGILDQSFINLNHVYHFLCGFLTLSSFKLFIIHSLISFSWSKVYSLFTFSWPLVLVKVLGPITFIYFPSYMTFHLIISLFIAHNLFMPWLCSFHLATSSTMVCSWFIHFMSFGLCSLIFDWSLLRH